MSSSQGNLPNGDDGDEETLRGRLRQLGVAPEKIAACTTPRMLGFLLQKVSARSNLMSGGTMVQSAPTQPSAPLPTLEEALVIVDNHIPSSFHHLPDTIVHVSFQVVGPGCTPAPVVLDLEASRTIFQAKVALACLLSALPSSVAAAGSQPLQLTAPEDILREVLQVGAGAGAPSRTTPARVGGVAPGQLQLVHAGKVVGDHVRLCELPGMAPAHGSPTRDSVRVSGVQVSGVQGFRVAHAGLGTRPGLRGSKSVSDALSSLMPFRHAPFCAAAAAMPRYAPCRHASCLRSRIVCALQTPPAPKPRGLGGR
ncbi:hypothetical protein T484DRAFT_1930485 [Baffinella frigidus]|nr:hypothetical protein T484DRAFT_1930485 [Cryptophyta sp. CCMP2293]